MKITKLPNALDPTFLIEQKIMEENFVCPYCEREVSGVVLIRGMER